MRPAAEVTWSVDVVVEVVVVLGSTAAGRGALSLLLEPGVERGGLHHDRLAAHERMAEAAQLGALERERAEAGGRDVHWVTRPGTMSSLTENCGTKTEWITSSERM